MWTNCTDIKYIAFFCLLENVIFWITEYWDLKKNQCANSAMQ